ncbi:methyl-accepting chemotaxis protein [Psychrobacillus psychrodurans]|uniref:Methyl-accepting chemotaxis protein n=1 Tax=Psychrobacillus psychrodurans TaxID=126157 RepID=A0A9X3LAH3_9BACI|nr:methyl-accepting chemotaxis protein [Psychrobacillus psychrodurans]MCZ8534177.1 methyl-accepting chemotaxis protein [Psychrobacillus psychrodurans]
MSIGKKLNLSFMAMILLLFISTGMAILSSTNVKDKVDEALDDRVKQLLVIEEIRVGIGMQGQYVRALLTDNTPEILEKLEYYASYVDEQIIEIDHMSSSKTMASLIEQMNVHNEEFNLATATYINYAKEKNLEAGTEILNTDIATANDGILEVAEQMMEYQDEQLMILTDETNDALSLSTTISIVMCIISIIIGILLVLFVHRKIASPLKAMASISHSIANGDLSQDDIPVESQDEIGQLATANNLMKNNLRSLLGRIQENSEHLSAAAEELSASTEEVTASTTEMANRANDTLQASTSAAQSASESALAMEETATGVQRIAESTQSLNESSKETYHTAISGGKIIDQASDQMNTINHSSNMVNELVQRLSKQTAEIENITNVITAITEQTNLLALNAAIEAARAGEQGKGFAVVADEVRKLAEESKLSANQIVELIQEIKGDMENVEKAAEESLTSVSDGVKIIGQAGISFEGIVTAVEKMNIQIEEISATSEEISASAEQVSASANEIATGTTNASANIESIAAAIEEQTATMEQVSGVAVELSQNALELQVEIQKFKLS